MKFDIHDHVTDRVVSVVLSDFLDKTVGSAVRLAGIALDLDDDKADRLASHAVIGVKAAMAGVVGNRYSGFHAARSLVAGEVSAAIDAYFETYEREYTTRHLGGFSDSQRAFNAMKAAALREAVSFASSYIGHVEKAHRNQHARSARS